MKKKMLAICLLLSMTAAVFSGCAGEVTPVVSSDPVSSVLPSSEEQSSEPESEPELEKPIINPLTGVADFPEGMLTQRPVAVMFNNVKPALPQKGIAEADIVYEMQVEANITRLMGVYSDYRAVPDLGSIRSARPDFIELLLPLNAIYVHFGQSEQAKTMLQEYDVSAVNGIKLVNKAFYFDEQRSATRSSEHCWFTNAELIQAGIDAEKIETEGDPIDPIFHFVSAGEEAMPADGRSATAITLPMSSYVTATFTYDEVSQTYAKGQFGAEHLDSNINQAAEVTNVFIMYTSCEPMADGYHKDIGLESGSGYYLSHGKLVEVSFQKAGPTEPMLVLDAAGEPVKVNPGKTWFSIVPTENREKTVIAGGDAAQE